jgi:hypothetical protein
MMDFLLDTPICLCYGTMGKIEVIDGAHGTQPYRTVRNVREMDSSFSQARLGEDTSLRATLHPGLRADELFFQRTETESLLDISSLKT